MGYSNINCLNVHKIYCEYYIDGMFCPEKCPGFIGESQYEEIIEKEIESYKEVEKKNKGVK